MKEIVLDINELSDSKELYAERPNPFISYFLYTVASLLIVALIYANIGTIEIVARTTGMIRSNDNVGTIASLISGKVIDVDYVDGQTAQVGEVLFEIDTSEIQLSYDTYLELKNEYELKLEMTNKFLLSIEQGKNLFDNDINSDEYPYYIQYYNYELSAKNTTLSTNHEESTVNANIDIYIAQKDLIQENIYGLTSFKKSIEKGENLSENFPEFEKQYLSYESNLNSLKTEYETQRKSTEIDASIDSVEYAKAYYSEQLNGYTKVLNAIKGDSYQFEYNENSIYSLLYEDYLNTVEEYQFNYDNAIATHEYYANGGAYGDNSIYQDDYVVEQIKSYKTQIEAYEFLEDSIKSNENKFDADMDSYKYSSLYTYDYLNNYNDLNDNLENLKDYYDSLLETKNNLDEYYEQLKLFYKNNDILEENDDIPGENDDIPGENDDIPGENDDIPGENDDIPGENDDIPGENDDIPGENDDIPGENDDDKVDYDQLLEETQIKIEKAEADIEYFVSKTLNDIPDTILSLKQNILAIEANYGINTNVYNLSTAKIQMDNAKEALESYKNKVLIEHNSKIRELETNIADANFNSISTIPKYEQLDILETSYLQSKEQQYYSTVTQIDSNIQSLESELASVNANLKLNQITSNFYKNNVGNDGKSITVSLAYVEQVSNILNNKESIENEIKNIDFELLKLEEQISQGKITADYTGILNANTQLVKGDILSAGSVVGTIIPQNQSEFKTQLYVSNADIAGIEVGDIIRYNIAALPSNQYGNVTGSVISISKDAIMQNDGLTEYFLVEGSIKNEELIDKDGNMASISIGMQVEGKIVTQEKVIMRYLLEKIDLF